MRTGQPGGRAVGDSEPSRSDAISVDAHAPPPEGPGELPEHRDAFVTRPAPRDLAPMPPPPLSGEARSKRLKDIDSQLQTMDIGVPLEHAKRIFELNTSTVRLGLFQAKVLMQEDSGEKTRLLEAIATELKEINHLRGELAGRPELARKKDASPKGDKEVIRSLLEERHKLVEPTEQRKALGEKLRILGAPSALPSSGTPQAASTLAPGYADTLSSAGHVTVLTEIYGAAVRAAEALFGVKPTELNKKTLLEKAEALIYVARNEGRSEQEIQALEHSRDAILGVLEDNFNMAGFMGRNLDIMADLSDPKKRKNTESELLDALPGFASFFHELTEAQRDL